MNFYSMSVLVEQHIDDLHKEAARSRQARVSKKHKVERPTRRALRLQRAPAP